MVTIELDIEKERPSFFFRSATDENIRVMLDTGAMISVWCQRKFLFLKHFPDARKTNYVTTIYGFGGVSSVKREIWEIPVFVLPNI